MRTSGAAQMDAVEITGNKVQLSGRSGTCHWSVAGIDVSAGFAASGNAVDDVTIAHNSVVGDAALGITVTSGIQGGSSNVVRHVRILQNRVRLGKRVQTGVCMPQDIEMAAGDTSGTPARPRDNLLGDVQISGNSLFNGEGMWIFTGGTHETLHGLRITSNSIHVVGPYPGVAIFGSGLPGITSTGNRVSDIVIDSNKVSVTSARPSMMRPSYGGIAIIGGDTMALGTITNSKFRTIRITNNTVDTTMPSISLVGGLGGGLGEGAANHNAIVGISISNNRILRRPTTWPGPPGWGLFEPGIRGIRIVGGLRKATGNRVSCVRLSRNRVAGAKNAASVVANALGASGNRATLAC